MFLDAARRAVLYTTISALTATTVVTLPAFLLSGLAIFLRGDLGLTRTQLGSLVSVYFTVCAVSSVPVGRLVERYGSSPTTAAGIILGALSLTGIGLAPSYPLLMAALMAGGVSNALGQLGSNLSLSQAVSSDRQGLAFGVKQAAIPASTLIAGAVVPVLGQTLGWRWGFGLAAILSLAALALVPRRNNRARQTASGPEVVAVAPLAIVALGATLAAGSANALSTFLVDWGVHTGLTPGHAALVLVAGSAVGVAARVGSGWLADRRGRGHLTTVSVQLVAGTFGLLLIAAHSVLPLVAGTIIGYGLGWSWPGLLNLAIVKLHPGAPAAATSIVQVGVYAGGAVGPLGFGFLADTFSFRLAWQIGAAAMCAGAVTLWVGRHMLVRHRPERPLSPPTDTTPPPLPVRPHVPSQGPVTPRLRR